MSRLPHSSHDTVLTAALRFILELAALLAIGAAFGSVWAILFGAVWAVYLFLQLISKRELGDSQAAKRVLNSPISPEPRLFEMSCSERTLEMVGARGEVERKVNNGQ